MAENTRILHWARPLAWASLCAFIAALPSAAEAQRAKKPPAKVSAKAPAKAVTKPPARARASEQPIPSLKLAPSAPQAADLKAGTEVRITTHKDDKTIATAVESGKGIHAATAAHKA